MLSIINDTKLTGRHSLYHIVGTNLIRAIAQSMQCGIMELWCMAYLKRNLFGQLFFCQIVEVAHSELLAPCLTRFIAISDKEHIVLMSLRTTFHGPPPKPNP